MFIDRKKKKMFYDEIMITCPSFFYVYYYRLKNNISNINETLDVFFLLSMNTYIYIYIRF
jgi:hypothetical protein